MTSLYLAQKALGNIFACPVAGLRTSAAFSVEAAGTAGLQIWQNRDPVPASGYKDSLVIAWLWGFLILAGCTKGVLFREKSQRKVKNSAKFWVGLQGLRTQNDRANLPVPAPSPMSSQKGLAKSLHLLHYLHQWLFDIPLFSTSSLLIKNLWIMIVVPADVVYLR